MRIGIGLLLALMLVSCGPSDARLDGLDFRITRLEDSALLSPIVTPSATLQELDDAQATPAYRVQSVPGASYSAKYTWVPQGFDITEESTCWVLPLEEGATGGPLPEHPQFMTGVTWVPVLGWHNSKDAVWCWNTTS